MSKLRLFVAVSLSDAVKAKVVRELKHLQYLAPKAKFVREEQLHLTLSFLGYVEEEQVGDISLALAQAAREVPPFPLSIEGGGTFGSPKFPRVLWMGVTGQREAVVELQGKVSVGLARLGFEPEKRAYSPHLTLARAAGMKGDRHLVRCGEELKEVSAGGFLVTQLELFRSQLSPHGAQYSVVKAYPLGSSREEGK